MQAKGRAFKYGDNVDTHTGIAIDERTMEEFSGCDDEGNRI